MFKGEQGLEEQAPIITKFFVCASWFQLEPGILCAEGYGWRKVDMSGHDCIIFPAMLLILCICELPGAAVPKLLQFKRLRQIVPVPREDSGCSDLEFLPLSHPHLPYSYSCCVRHWLSYGHCKHKHECRYSWMHIYTCTHKEALQKAHVCLS